jgi:hypothetical protein
MILTLGTVNRRGTVNHRRAPADDLPGTDLVVGDVADGPPSADDAAVGGIDDPGARVREEKGRYL